MLAAQDALVAPAPPYNRFGSALKLSKVHRVRPEVVVEVTYLTWTEDNLLRQVSYQGQREEKPVKQVVRSLPPPKEEGAEQLRCGVALSKSTTPPS